MPTFAEIAQKFRNINLMLAFLNALKKNGNEYEFIATIQERLYNKGLTSSDLKLKTDKSGGGSFYSKNTIRIKREKNQIASHVTLKDRGDFYNSWKLKYSNEFFNLTAIFEKDTSNIADNFTKQFSSSQKFEDAILSMSPKEMQEFLHKVIFDDFINELKKQI